MAKKKNQRGPYKCTKCREYGHRANKCPNAHKYQKLLDSLPGAEALVRLVPDSMQILAILEGEAGAALVGAIKGNEALAERGIPHNDSMINAWTELNVRAAKISSAAINKARAARVALIAAETAYHEALAPIRAALGHKSTTPSIGKATKP